MCGIVGFISKEKKKKEIIKKMADRIKHRGPDGCGYYIDNNCALGHRRLAILDIHEGKQPMFNERGDIVVIFNGEIYNYPEIKAELIAKNYIFKTNCDTECLIYGYQEWKERLPSKLRGMFAFAIYDKKEQKLFCAKDPFGIKPFYYYQKENEFLFASEIKAFLEHPQFKKELNKEILEAYLMFGFTPTEETFFKNVYRLKPGHYLIYQNHHCEIKKYYHLEFNEKKQTLEESIKEIGEVMQESVNRHLQSDVEVASFLSSGIDSSYIVSLAKPNKTYTVGYQEENYSEINYAKDLAEKLQINNTSKKISKEEYLKIIPKAMYYLDEPLSDAAAIALYFLSEIASKEVKVVLSGEGADEFFAGYNTYREIVDIGFYNKIPFPVRHLIAKILAPLPEFKGRNFFVRRGLKIEDSYVGINPVFKKREAKKIVVNNDEILVKDMLKETLEPIQEKSNLIQMQMVDLNFWLANDILHKADRMTMAHAVELRVPFIDKEVFKVASKLPENQKVTKENTKIALREAAKTVIPNESYKKKKLGFPVPLRKWLSESDFYHEVEKTIKQDFVSEFFNQEHALKLLQKCKKKKKDTYKKVWAIYTFIKWYEVFFLNNET